MENSTVHVPGDVGRCVACGGEAVYTRIANSLFNAPREAAYPGRYPDVHAWVCRRCGHEEREAPVRP